MTSYPAGGYSPSAWSFMAAPPNAPPASLAESGVWQSGVIAIQGYNSLSASALLTQAGTIVIQRYMDSAGTVPIGAPISQTLAANTVGSASVNDGIAFMAFQVTVTNTSSSSGTLSDALIVAYHTGAA